MNNEKKQKIIDMCKKNNPTLHESQKENFEKLGILGEIEEHVEFSDDLDKERGWQKFNKAVQGGGLADVGGYEKEEDSTDAMARIVDALKEPEVGWQCPVCMKGNAPHADKCYHC